MNRLTIDFGQLLSSIDLVPLIVIVGGIMAFWVGIVWCIMLVLKFMDNR